MAVPLQHVKRQASYIIYSVNSDDPDDEANEAPGYDSDTDGLAHYYLMVQGTPSCKQYYTVNNKAVGPVYYKYSESYQNHLEAADNVKRDAEIRVFLCTQ